MRQEFAAHGVGIVAVTSEPGGNKRVRERLRERRCDVGFPVISDPAAQTLVRPTHELFLFHEKAASAFNRKPQDDFVDYTMVQPALVVVNKDLNVELVWSWKSLVGEQAYQAERDGESWDHIRLRPTPQGVLLSHRETAPLMLLGPHRAALGANMCLGLPEAMSLAAQLSVSVVTRDEVEDEAPEEFAVLLGGVHALLFLAAAPEDPPQHRVQRPGQSSTGRWGVGGRAGVRGVEGAGAGVRLAAAELQARETFRTHAQRRHAHTQRRRDSREVVRRCCRWSATDQKGRMVFVFLKSSYAPNQSKSMMKQLKMLLGVVALLTAYLVGGAIIFRYINPQFRTQGNNAEFETTFLDAMYFVVVTLTTVGYGDIVPSNDETKIFVSLYIIVSLVLVGVALEVTDFLFQIDVEEIEEGGEVELDKFLTRGRKRLMWNLLWVFLFMFSSVIFFVFQDEESFTAVDAIYFTVATMTTVGYGDFTPRSDEGRIFSIFWVSAGCLVLFRCVGSLMDVMLEARKRKWTKSRAERQNVLMHHLSARVGIINMVNVPDTQVIQKYTKQELIDVLTKLEFIMYRLEKEGKVEIEDFRRLDEEFKGLTPEALDAEFKEEHTSMVFGSMVGNYEK
ncbi:Two pore potassium channel a (Two K(+) channel a) (Calcium-activated outward-rectifying potassium channel 1) (OsKCO1) [Durusdinium trenchii]|uniref:Two pore potassium channel a (Two K(+) channel a) (Calcium-activated outward-rectifying potassium channel 1) (OsKCO1) n=1 Tax=Durusdinium trenchii TaxID=1381693 RepID=A0ABP0SHJ3_9DINO